MLPVGVKIQSSSLHSHSNLSPPPVFSFFFCSFVNWRDAWESDSVTSFRFHIFRSQLNSQNLRTKVERSALTEVKVEDVCFSDLSWSFCHGSQQGHVSTEWSTAVNMPLDGKRPVHRLTRSLQTTAGLSFPALKFLSPVRQSWRIEAATALQQLLSSSPLASQQRCWVWTGSW